MTYQLETTSQLYGNQQYLAHNLKGATPELDRQFFAQRIASYGIFSFGAFTSRQTKRVVLADQNITSPISLVSAYAFASNATSDEIRFRLLADTQQIAEQRISSNDMPFAFPPGAIIDPTLTIEVESRYGVTQLLIYWQPVHILSHIQIN